MLYSLIMLDTRKKSTRKDSRRPLLHHRKKMDSKAFFILKISHFSKSTVKKDLFCMCSFGFEIFRLLFRIGKWVFGYKSSNNRSFLCSLYQSPPLRLNSKTFWKYFSNVIIFFVRRHFVFQIIEAKLALVNIDRQRTFLLNVFFFVGIWNNFLSFFRKCC